ncbi:MAG: hypothetical protein HY744_21620 [Deltaproteobacteria bacterium]|nr:hypothetical protein [Deltaproteobacteria bacterium]
MARCRSRLGAYLAALPFGLLGCTAILGDDYEVQYCDDLGNCDKCTKCARSGQCAQEQNTCNANPSCGGMLDCMRTNCGGKCPPEVPDKCEDCCRNENPQGWDAYVVLMHCSRCECRDTCNYDGKC